MKYDIPFFSLKKKEKTIIKNMTLKKYKSPERRQGIK